jgi:hypothetical protein
VYATGTPKRRWVTRVGGGRRRANGMTMRSPPIVEQCGDRRGGVRALQPMKIAVGVKHHKDDSEISQI